MLLIHFLDKLLNILYVSVINIMAIVLSVGTLGLIGFAIAKNALSFHGGNNRD